MPTGVLIAPGIWDAARKAVERGESYEDVARRLGLKYGTIKARSKRDKWLTPSRRALAMAKAAPDTRVSESPEPPPGGFEGDLPGELAPHRENLLKALHAGPEAFREALKQASRASLATSWADIPAPRTLAEFKTVVDILEKTEKMGEKGGPEGFVRSMRGVARAPAIEAEVIDLGAGADGFAI